MMVNEPFVFIYCFLSAVFVMSKFLSSRFSSKKQQIGRINETVETWQWQNKWRQVESNICAISLQENFCSNTNGVHTKAKKHTKFLGPKNQNKWSMKSSEKSVIHTLIQCNTAAHMKQTERDINIFGVNSIFCNQYRVWIEEKQYLGTRKPVYVS